MSLPDISTVRDLDLDILRKAEHFRLNNKVYVRVGNSDEVPLYVALTGDPNEEDLQVFDEALSVTNGDEITVVEYIVPPAKVLSLDNILVSGSNVAKYTVLIDNLVNKIKYTYYGASLNENFDYNSYKLTAGTNIKVKVVHNNDLNHSGDFFATIEGKLKDA